VVGTYSTLVPGSCSDADWDFSCCKRYVTSGQYKSSNSLNKDNRDWLICIHLSLYFQIYYF
jgi:predicted RNase H-like nuclease